MSSLTLTVHLILNIREIEKEYWSILEKKNTYKVGLLGVEFFAKDVVGGLTLNFNTLKMPFIFKLKLQN